MKVLNKSKLHDFIIAVLIKALDEWDRGREWNRDEWDRGIEGGSV